MWVTSAEPLGRLWKIDPKTIRATVLLQTPSAPGLPLYSSGGPAEVTTAGGSVWVGFGNATEVARVNPGTGQLEQQLSVTKTEGTILQASASQIWVLLQTCSSSPNNYVPDRSQPGRVGRIDPRTGAFTGKDLKIGSSGGYDSFAAGPTMPGSETSPTPQSPRSATRQPLVTAGFATAKQRLELELEPQHHPRAGT